MENELLSRRSLDKLEGVDDRLVAVVKHAITATKVDFGVIQGLRTLEQQKELFEKKASQTMKSKHLTGHAVDLMAYINGRGSWELQVYDEIADAMKEGASMVGCKLRWGSAWHIDSIGDYEGTMEDALNEYIDLRRSQGRRPFIDAPHFELM